MRVLLFGPYPLPGQPISGGVMAVVRALAQGLARRGVTVGVASALAGGEDRDEWDGEVRVYRRGIPRLPRARGHRAIRSKLLAAARDFRPTLIHAHGTVYYAAAALDGPWPALITAHGVAYEEARRSRARGIKARLAWRYDAYLERNVLKRTRYAIAINPYIRQAFAHYGHITWFDIPNPVDDAFFEVTRVPERGRLFTPARVIPRKGTDIIIQAFAAIADDVPQAQLRIAGEKDSLSEFVERCQELAEKAGIRHRVHFLGNLNRAALLEEYRRAWVTVLPSRQETAPVAIAEAFAAGCPVIATRVGGVPWMVRDAVDGLLVPSEDAEALADALAQALSDGEKVNVWSQRTRLAAQPYRLDAVLDATLTVYERVKLGDWGVEIGE
ncbi:MAG TPA: glycosyltransferase family 1 protein [Anaerolineae bacterium]|nr:glycosyltransferase family 4 protein [Caldilineae bacterium]HID34662.1 glycosyltransferase family 1 protein [Anaerolineae bacterium]HIQ12371.1 glycosyltransferase family 1 protein [Caldilineales bacterium]